LDVINRATTQKKPTSRINPDAAKNRIKNAEEVFRPPGVEAIGG